jgi:hypothetical protein
MPVVPLAPAFLQWHIIAEAAEPPEFNIQIQIICSLAASVAGTIIKLLVASK